MYTTHTASNTPRMFCYLWHEKTDVNECKFGERWVKAGEDPLVSVLKRVKESVGVRKDKFNDGTVQVVEIWDVSELAKKVGRYYQRSRMDDYIRSFIGFRKGTTGEIHELDVHDFKSRVNKQLNKAGQPLKEVGLSQNQHDALVDVLTAVYHSKRTVVAELCARFGKTIWAGALIKETYAELTVIASYVLTSFASFTDDLKSYEQFKDMVLIDSADDNYEDVVNESLLEGKQVVVLLSLCNGGKRQRKIDFLYSRPTAYAKLTIVDEADFGAHQLTQAQPLIDAMGEKDVTVLMTGTDADKASSAWDVDHYLSVTYAELLMEKKKNKV